MKHLIVFIFICTLFIGHISLAFSDPRDKHDKNSIVIFTILGFLNEYAGRTIVEDGDDVEHFFCDEHDKALLFQKYLEDLKVERNINTIVQEKIVQKCLTDIYSRELTKTINSFYKYEFKSENGDKKKTTNALIDRDIFLESDRESKLAYLKGAYLRYGYGDSLTLFNAKHKVDLIIDLLKEVGCTNVSLNSENTIPVTYKIGFHPTDEIKKLFKNIPAISGTHREYYNNGALFREMNYKGGKLEGIFKEYYESGKLLKEQGYEDGVLKYTKTYYENENLFTDGYVKDGNLDGISKRYYETGEVEYEWTFKNGILDGIAKEFHKNGALRATINYVDDKREGAQKVYYENGTLKKEYFYQNDAVISEKTYDKEGNLITSE